MPSHVTIGSIISILSCELIGRSTEVRAIANPGTICELEELAEILPLPYNEIATDGFPPDPRPVQTMDSPWPRCYPPVTCASLKSMRHAFSPVVNTIASCGLGFLAAKSMPWHSDSTPHTAA